MLLSTCKGKNYVEIYILEYSNFKISLQVNRVVSDFRNLEILELFQSFSKHFESSSGVSWMYPENIEFSIDHGGKSGSGTSPGGGIYSGISGLGKEKVLVDVFSKKFTITAMTFL